MLDTGSVGLWGKKVQNGDPETCTTKELVRTERTKGVESDGNGRGGDGG